MRLSGAADEQLDTAGKNATQRTSARLARRRQTEMGDMDAAAVRGPGRRFR
jgi:hypothetical protein